MHQSTGNKLENWIKARFAEEREMMNILQEYGVISDNAISAKEVGNDKQAMMWLAKNFERITKRRV